MSDPAQALREARELGMRVAELRQRRGMSLQDVANRCGVSKPHVWSLETGKSCNPTLAIIKELARCFSVPVLTLIGEDTAESKLHPAALEIAIVADGAIRRALAAEQAREGAE
jgi:transcriptional regulator with XRE-family HTH domain